MVRRENEPTGSGETVCTVGLMFFNAPLLRDEIMSIRVFFSIMGTHRRVQVSFILALWFEKGRQQTEKSYSKICTE